MWTVNLGQHPEGSRLMSVCGVTEDYKENFQKAVLQKGGKNRCFISINNILELVVFFFFLDEKGLNMLNIDGKESVEKEGLKIKGWPLCVWLLLEKRDVKPGEVKHMCLLLEWKWEVHSKKQCECGPSHLEGSSRGTISRCNWVGAWLEDGHIAK